MIKLSKESYRQCPMCKHEMKWKCVEKVFKCTNCGFEEGELKLVMDIREAK